MHNWHLLLLAFLAAFQPISTYTERNFDGRQQCSDRSPLRDTELFYGRHRSNKFAPEDRRLNHPEAREIRLETRRYEVRANSLTPTTTDKRVVAKREREEAQSTEQARFSRAPYQDRKSRERFTDVSRERVANVDRVRNSREEEDRHISSRDSNRRSERIQEVSSDRTVRASRDVRQDGRDNHKSTNRLSRVERRNNDERPRLSFDARRESRTARDLIGQSQKNAEIRETRIALQRERDEVARRESEGSRIQERIGQENRRISFRRDSRLQPRERKFLDQISEDERRSSLNRGEAERWDIRREARDENRAREERNLFQRERTESSRNTETTVRTERSIENQRKRESRIDSPKEQRLQRRVSESDSRSTKTDFRDTRMKSATRSEPRDNERLEIKMVRSSDRKVRRVDVQRVNERESRIIRENSRDTERQEISGDIRLKSKRVAREAKTSRSRATRLTAEFDPQRNHESNRNLERLETRTNERHDVSRDAPRSSRMESNRVSLSISNLESSRVHSRRVNERESQKNRENIRLNYFRESKIQPSRSDEPMRDLEVTRVDTLRTSVQRNGRKNELVDSFRQKRVDFNRLSRMAADSETQRRSNKQDSQTIREIMRRESRTSRAKSTRSLDREVQGTLETRRIDSRRINERKSKKIRENSPNIERLKQRSNVRLINVRDSRLSQSAESVADLEARRVDSQKVNEREYGRIRQSRRDMERLQQRSNDALNRRPSRSADQVADFEGRRVDTRRVNERESRTIRESDTKRLQQRSNDAFDKTPSRSSDRVASEARRVDSRRVNERESRRISESRRVIEHLQQRSNDALDRRLSRSADRVAVLEARRVNSQKNNQRQSIRTSESSRDVARLQRRSNDVLERRLSKSADSVADLEPRRVDSRRNNERESKLRNKYLNLERRSADRFDTSRGSSNIFTRSVVDNLENRKKYDTESSRIREKRETSRNIRREARIFNSFALERDIIESRIPSNVDMVRNRHSWNLNEKELEDSKPFSMNWQCILYTLQGIYLSIMLLQVLGSDKKKIRSHGFWGTAPKLIKVD